MYICVCKAVSVGQVTATIDAGADSLDAVTQTCCAGAECGTCHDAIEALIQRRRARVAPGPRAPVGRAA
jgi:bacterioferritin-associated ferredoxin